MTEIEETTKEKYTKKYDLDEYFPYVTTPIGAFLGGYWAISAGGSVGAVLLMVVIGGVGGFVVGGFIGMNLYNHVFRQQRARKFERQRERRKERKE